MQITGKKKRETSVTRLNKIKGMKTIKLLGSNPVLYSKRSIKAAEVLLNLPLMGDTTRTHN